MRTRALLPTLVLSVILPVAAVAQVSPSRGGTAGADPDGIRDMDAVVVSGVQPGPGLWKVSRDGNVMWVLGTLSPLPKKMDWEAREVEAVIAGAQEVMLEPGVDVDADVGFFGGLALAPKLYAARKNPDGKQLKEIVPAADYARWTALKAQYIGSDRGIEKWRPMFAAFRLYREAVEDVGLRQGGVVTPVVEKLARAHGVTVSRPMVELTIEDPKQALAEFREAEVQDLGCFQKTLMRVDRDMDVLRERANAWAVGDIIGLRGLPFREFNDCQDAWNSVQAMQRRIGDVRALRDAEWLREAERVLSSNKVTLALLPMRELLSDDGLAATLGTRGYTVQAPGEYVELPGDQTDAVSVEAAAVD